MVFFGEILNDFFVKMYKYKLLHFIVLQGFSIISLFVLFYFSAL